MQVVPALADRESDLRNEKAATSSQLEATNNQIYNLEVQKEALQAEIDQMDAQLVDIMVAIDVLTEEISQKQAEIEETKGETAGSRSDTGQAVRGYEDSYGLHIPQRRVIRMGTDGPF